MAEAPESPTPAPKGSLALGSGRVRWTALGALAILVGLAIWLIVETVGDDDSSLSPTVASSEPVAVSATGVATLAQAVGGPVYWVGPRGVSRYEVSQQNGQIYVRYLPDGVEAGDPRALLTVATYPVDNAYEVTSKIQGAEVIRIPSGGIAVVSSDRPTSAYVAFPGVDHQIEVFVPDPEIVKRLVTDGAVRPVSVPQPTATARAPEAVSQDELAALADELEHPVYWAGSRDSTTYELTVTTNGHVFVRYLPAGVDVGDPSQVLTVGTYPVEGAYEVTKQGGAKADSGTVEGDGRTGVYRKTSARNVYLAFPGEDVQVEVYSPVVGEAAKLVAQGKIVPVG